MKRQKNEIREELNELSPFLSKMKEEENGFKVPQNYFKTLPNQVFQKLGSEPSPLSTAQNSSPGFWNNFNISIQSLLKPKYALAFSTVVLMLLVGVFWMNNSSEPATYANLTSEEIQNYISDNIDEFEEELLVTIDFGFEDIQSSEDIEVDDYLDEIIDEIIDEIEIEDLEELL